MPRLPCSLDKVTRYHYIPQHMGLRPIGQGMECTQGTIASDRSQREFGSGHRVLTRFPNIPETWPQRPRRPRSRRFLPAKRRQENFDWLFSTSPHRTGILRRLSPQPPTERKSLTSSVFFL